MYPNLFRFPEWLPLIGGQQLTSFGVMMFLSFLTAGLILRSEMGRAGFDRDHAWDILFWAVIGGIGGAKLYYLLMHLPDVLDDPVRAILARGGLTWYGGLILASGLVAWKIRSLKLPMGAVFDCMAPAMPVAIAIGRMGCFLVGDDYGFPTDSWVGIAFPEGAPPTRVDILERDFGVTVDPALIERYGQIVPVHPAQLYEVAIALVLVAPIVWRFRGHRFGAGWLFSLWMALYGVERFLVEIVRAKDDRFIFDIFTSAQLLSVVITLTGIFLMVRLSRVRSEGTREARGGT